MDDNTNSAEQLPKAIGRFQVVSALGFGAMGAVYKAFDPLIKRTLAIKTIRLDIPRTSPQYKSFIDRFHHEARISGTLSHPNIVTLFDIGEDGGLPYLAMEYIEGQPVAALLDAGHKFKPERVIALASQVAAALDYAHGRGVIHRDIKPSNLMIYGDDKLKVADFGIAKLVDTDMTQSGTLLGTPSYMSPEQAMGDKLDGRSDIFSLGVCCFEMLSGEQPFPGVNVTSILYKLVHVDPIEPANLEMNGLVPQKWHEVFGKVLAKKPEDRYQTATAFVQDLEFCLGSWFGGLGSPETILVSSGEIAALAGTSVPITTEAMPAYVEPAAPPFQAPMPAPLASKSTAVPEVGSDTVPPRFDAKAKAPTGSLPSKGAPPAPEEGADDPKTVVLRASPKPPLQPAKGPAHKPVETPAGGSKIDEVEAQTILVRGSEGTSAEDSDTRAFRAIQASKAPISPSGAPETSAARQGRLQAAGPAKAVPAPPVVRPPLPAQAEEGTVMIAVPPSSRVPVQTPPTLDAEEGTVADAAEGTVILSVPSKPKLPSALSSPVETEEGTLVLSVPPILELSGPRAPSTEGTVLMATPMVPPARGVQPDDEGTVVTAVSGPTVLTPRPGPTPLPASDPLLSNAPKSVAGPGGSKPLPIALILGGAALLFVLGLGFLGCIAYRKLVVPSSEPTPSPLAEVTPTPAPSAPHETPAAVVTGLVRVDSVPAGATVLVDGQERGTTPTEIAELALGSHGVRVQLSGYEPGSETVELGADAPTADLRFTLTKAQPTTGSGDIRSTPAGGQLRVDGRPSGTTPRSSLRLRAGTHKLEIALEGHEPWTGRIEITAGQVTRVDATLKPLPKPTPTPTPADVVDPNRVYQNVAGDVDVLAKRISGKIEGWPRGVPELRSDDSASVTVQFVVTEDGEVQDPKVTQSTGRSQVDEVVLKAVRGFRYNPAQKKGVKVKVRVSFTQTFRAG